MNRGDIYWADLGPPAGRRLVLIVTRTRAIGVLSAVVVAPVSRTVRDIASEVQLGPDDGLSTACAASCDNLLTVPKSLLDPAPAGSLAPARTIELDAALRFALQIEF